MILLSLERIPEDSKTSFAALFLALKQKIRFQYYSKQLHAKTVYLFGFFYMLADKDNDDASY